MSNKEFIRALDDECDRALIAVGFERPRRGCRVLEISPSFLGWVGLNRGVHSEFVQINPFVGIHCVPLMRLCAELEGEKYGRGDVSTYAIHLGELAPDVLTFRFNFCDPVDFNARRLAAVIVEYAMPFMRSLSSYEALLPRLEERVPMLGGYPERLAATLYLMGEFDRARGFALERRKKYEGASQLVRESFDRFAVPFLRMLDTTDAPAAASASPAEEGSTSTGSATPRRPLRPRS